MGKMIYRSGNIYSGQWDNNLANGKGTMKYNNGNKYTGEWIDNERNGYGEMTYNDNGIYKGYFLADKNMEKEHMKIRKQMIITEVIL